MSDFKNDSLLTLTAETTYTGLASCSLTRIIYKKPDGQTGYWNGTVSGTKIIYNTSPGDIDQAGDWEFQAYIMLGSLQKWGTIVVHNFKTPIL